MMMMQFMGGSPGHTMAMMPQMPQMPQMQNNIVAMQPQQSMNETVLAVSPPHHATKANTSATPPSPLDRISQRRVKQNKTPCKLNNPAS